MQKFKRLHFYILLVIIYVYSYDEVINQCVLCELSLPGCVTLYEIFTYFLGIVL